MKKLIFGLIIGMMFFASCTQEALDDFLAQKPVVEFVSEEGFISGNTGVYVGEELNFKVKVAPNASSASELAHFDFSITDLDGTTVVNQDPEFTDPTGENFFTFSYTPSKASTYTVTATLTDKAGKVNIATIVIDYVEPIIAELGTYSGKMTINGHITSNEVAGQVYDEDLDIEDIAFSVMLGAINEEGRVSATLEIDGTPVTLYGTKTGNTIVFDEFHFHKTITLLVDITLNLAMNVTGVMEDNDTMTLSGTASGSGKTQIAVAILEVDMTGNINGTLVKKAE